MFQKLSHVVDLRIPNFLETVPEGTVGQFSFSKRSTTEWYEEFKDKCISSIGQKYLPVFRISDGEFYFATGFRIPYPGTRNPFWHYFRSVLGSLRLGRFPWAFRSGAPKYGWEEYYGLEWLDLRKKFIQYLDYISKYGLVAVNFTVTDPPFAEQYVSPFCSWLDKNHIDFNNNNYYPFYFVYALLNGPDSSKIIGGKRILVITSYDEDKKKLIEEGLLRLHANDVQFLSISRNKSMMDKISTENISSPVDVILIGAGVGASSILYQLRNIETLCIDAGFCLECIADPLKKKNRVFCVPDGIKLTNTW
jgi:hypothetical protein